MGTLLVELLPLIVGAAVLPVWIIMSLFLLRGPGGLASATAFAVGAIIVRLVQGLLFGIVWGAADAAHTETGSSLITSILLLVVGIAMLVTAVRYWLKAEDPDAPPPKWMAMLSSLSALKAFGMGALLMVIAIKQWVFTLSAIAVITQANLGQIAGVFTYLVFTFAAQSLVLAPVVVYAIAPTRTAQVLDTAQAWLERNNRVIMIVVSTIFGLWFTWKGVTGLIG